MKVKLLFAWYDLWIGLFYDKQKRWLYVLPLPMCGFILKFKSEAKPATIWYSRNFLHHHAADGLNKLESEGYEIVNVHKFKGTFGSQEIGVIYRTKK